MFLLIKVSVNDMYIISISIHAHVYIYVSLTVQNICIPYNEIVFHTMRLFKMCVKSMCMCMFMYFSSFLFIIDSNLIIWQ